MTRKLTIIGGGITGLAAAFLAARQGWKVTVLEATDKLGGLLETFPIGGTRLEFFYHHFFMHDAELLWMLKELRIENAVEFRKTSMGVFRDGEIYDFNSPLDLLRFSPMHLTDKVRFAASSLFLSKCADWRRWEDRSALEWFYRHAGRNATDCLWKPLLDVKFGPYAGQVPVAWMVGRLRQRLNSRKGAEERLGYLRGSLHLLLEAIIRELDRLEVDLRPGARLEEVEIRQGALTAVKTPQGRIEGGDFLVTIPTIHLAPLLREACPAYAAELDAIQYFGAVCTVLEMERPLSPIYWLNVADPGFPFGGVIEHTNLVPAAEYGGSHIAYLSRYFAHSDPIAAMTPEEIGTLMVGAMKRIYPGFDPAHIRNRSVFRTRTAAVVCDLNFSKRVPSCRSPVRNLFVANMTHVYPDERSCNNSIRVAAEACRVMGIDTSHVPARSSLAGKIGMSSILSE